MNKKLKKYVTSYLNDLHLSNNSTIGSNDLGKSIGNPLNPSINLSSAYAFRTIDELNEYHDNKRDNTRYARDGNDLARQAEEYFGHIFDKSTCFLFNSGMAAVSCALNVLYNKIDNIVTFGVFYRKSEVIISDAVKRFSINHLNVVDDEFSILSSLEGKTLFFIENFSNPFLRLTDVKKIKKEFPDSFIILDLTLQGLITNEEDSKHADIVVSSCTKYIGGHNDILAGVLSTKNKDLVKEVWDFRSSNGCILGSFESYLLLRSLRTYDLRIAQIEKNTNHVISFLKEHPKIKRIFYPFAFSNDDQAIMGKQYSFHGGVISFEVIDEVNLERNIGKLCSTKMAPSFGSVDSLIEIPFFMSKREKGKIDEKHYHSLIFSKKFIRFSVGCEPFSYIYEDLNTLLA
jgi:cystathionine gamma-lyase / homocysteine desulfhydrase